MTEKQEIPLATENKHTPESLGEDPSVSKKRRGRFWLIVILLIVFGGGYLFGAFHFTFNAYPKSFVNGHPMGGQPQEAFREIHPSSTTHVYTGRDAQIKLNANDIGLRYLLKGDLPKQASPWLWPIEYFRTHDYSSAYEITYDEERLAYLLREAGFDPEGEAPQDAMLEATADGVRIKPEVQGKRVNADRLKAKILHSIESTAKEISLEDVYEKPKVFKDDPSLQEDKKNVEKLLASTLVYSIGNANYRFGAQEIFPLLKKDDNGAYSLPVEGIQSFVRKMAKKTDTYGTSRSFQSTGAGEQTVPPGIYGWQINVKKTTEQVQELLKKGGVQENLEPVYRHKGIARGEKNDIGNTYIEIDISRQQIWGYKDGDLIVKSYVRTGRVNHYNETPRGVHMIWSHEKDRHLKGQFKDGTPYDSPVKYWMPINYGGVGLHDASWVTAFGGQHYRYAGSNGCINLNLETAKTIFENFANGTPVVIYESTTNDSPADKTF